MKRIAFLFLSFLSFRGSFCQDWTAAQLDSANTAKDINYLTDVEKAVIRYINLARLYPQLFISNELVNYNGPVHVGETLKNSSYKKSLGASSAVTHKRKRCPYGYRGECCSYGMDTGKDIALQWLTDDKVAGTGHRANCLSREYTLIGIAYNEHRVYRQCAVADFR